MRSPEVFCYLVLEIYKKLGRKYSIAQWCIDGKWQGWPIPIETCVHIDGDKNSHIAKRIYLPYLMTAQIDRLIKGAFL